MKLLCVFIILQIVATNISAQKLNPDNLRRPEPVNVLKDKKEYQGYIIKLKTGSLDSYEFDISTNNKPTVHQFHNPLAFSPRGIRKKEDAYKIAQWIIDDYIKTGHWQNMVPPHIVRQLEIELN